MTLVYVAVGGALGSLVRYLVTSGCTRWLGHGFPYGTLLVNVLGSLAMGALIGWMARATTGFESLRLLIGVGFLGGFTTFSAFSLDVVMLFERGEMLQVLLYLFASVTVSVMALMAGLYVMRMVGAA